MNKKQQQTVEEGWQDFLKYKFCSLSGIKNRDSNIKFVSQEEIKKARSVLQSELINTTDYKYIPFIVVEDTVYISKEEGPF